MLSQSLKTLFKYTLCLMVILSCASRNRGGALLNSKDEFKLKDRSGEFILQREVKLNKGEVATRITVVSPSNSAVASEKTISISKLGISKNSKILRPQISQHEIWYEKERYFSQLKTNVKTKSLDVIMKSPEEKWQGESSLPYPAGRIFCFFTQIPECAKFYGMLNPESEVGFKIVVIWDNYPYHNESYLKLSSSPFQTAAFSFDGEHEGGLRYKLELSNQIIFYEFDVNRQFDKMYWIAQGITLVRTNRKLK
jgi:hypothetical protein